MLLIATFVRNPGVGHINCLDSTADSQQDSLAEVGTYLEKTAVELGIDIASYSRYTIQSDLKTLRRYGILGTHRYRWGYYLGTGVMNRTELRTAFNTIASQAKTQNDQVVVSLHKKLTRMLKNTENKLAIPYPVRTQLGRTIVHTDPVEMMEQQKYRDTLFEKLSQIESAILSGRPIELFRCKNPYDNNEKNRYERVFPLQLVYSDIAWYLLQEDYATGHFFMSRIDRFTDHLEHIKPVGRGIECQRKQLRVACQLIDRGWGLHLGSREEQKKEIEGIPNLVEIRVRFFEKVAAFIIEGEKRHPSQKLELGPKNKNNQLRYVDYSLSLPTRSVKAFCQWVYRFMGNAQFIYPDYLIEDHQMHARELMNRYSSRPN